MNYREIRRKNGYTQFEIAQYMDVSQGTVSKFESGLNSNQELHRFYEWLCEPSYVPVTAIAILFLGAIALIYLIFG